MGKAFRHRILVWHVLLFGCMGVWLCVCSPGIAWAEATEQEEKTIIDLKDGSVIELTEDAVIRRGKQPDAPEIWSIPAKQPTLPLEFENRDGLSLLLYFVLESEHYGEFHAVRVEDGQEQWIHPIWPSHSVDMPVSPIFLNSWIYYGRAGWLEQMNPDDGKIVERYPARERILSLQVLPDGDIEVQVEVLDDKISLRFQEGQFSPHIVAPGNLLVSLRLFKRPRFVLEDFDSYLDLHRIQRDLLSPEFVAKWRNFDLREAEKVYRQAYQRDRADPSFALYLAFSLYYQGRQTEAESYFQEALLKSADFWEESLHLGGFLCEPLRLTQWADAFYEQGTARYFQEAPVPPQEVTFIEVLIHFGGQRASSAGQLDRALHVLDLRRQIFPYTEGDTLFSRNYIRWLQRMGQEEQALLEEQRIGRTEFLFESEDLTPGSFIGFMVAGFLVGGMIILKNEIHHWYEFFIVIISMCLMGVAIFLYGRLGVKSVIPIGITLVGYIGTIAFFRRRRLLRENRGNEGTTVSSSSLWRMMLSVMASSYLVILIGVFVSYILGRHISHSALGGKVVEILFILAFIGSRRWIRRHSGFTLPFRHLTMFVCLWVLLWGYFAWFSYYVGVLGQEWSIPIPSIDPGHPNRVAHIDQKVNEALFRNRDLLFTQAVFHQVGGDVEFVRKTYENMLNETRALNNLGVMVLDENPDDAQAYFEQALDLDQDFAPALYNLGLLTGDQKRIEQAKTSDPWRVTVYQKYAPDKPWITIPTTREWSKAIYWSQGGFLVRGFVEISFSIRDMFGIFIF